MVLLYVLRLAHGSSHTHFMNHPSSPAPFRVFCLVAVILCIGGSIRYGFHPWKSLHETPSSARDSLPAARQTSQVEATQDPLSRTDAAASVVVNPVLFDASRYSTDGLYRAAMADHVRNVDADENPIYKTPDAARLRQLLASKGLAGRDLRVYVRWAAEDIVLDKWNESLESEAFQRMKAEIGDKVPDFNTGSISEIYYSDMKRAREEAREAAISQFMGMTGIDDREFYRVLFQLNISTNHFPALESPLVSLEGRPVPVPVGNE